MSGLIYRLGVGVILVGLLGQVETSAAPVPPIRNAELKVVAFNIRYFGSGGSGRGTGANEKRDATIRDFMAKHVFPADVISFEEIIDVPRLRRLLPTGWDCISYDEEDLEHQHVVLCASPQYDWQKEPTDDNWTWESIVIPGGKLRPAVHAILTERNGRAVARVVGLHLKAFPDKSDVRLKQTELLASELRKVRDRNLPVVILGDLNTYPSPANQMPKGDEEAMEEVLDRQVHDFVRAPNQMMTFRSATMRGRYDQIYYSANLRPVGAPTVFPVCDQKEGNNGTGYMNATYYYTNVSDHCPLKLTLSIRPSSIRR